MSEMVQVLEKLETIEGQTNETNNNVNKLLQWKAGMEVQCLSHREKTEEVRTTVFGSNGSKGLKVMVQRLWNCKGALRDSKALWQDFYMYVLKALVIAGILAAIAFTYKMYSMHNGGS